MVDGNFFTVVDEVLSIGDQQLMVQTICQSWLSTKWVIDSWITLIFPTFRRTNSTSNALIIAQIGLLWCWPKFGSTAVQCCSNLKHGIYKSWAPIRKLILKLTYCWVQRVISTTHSGRFQFCGFNPSSILVTMSVGGWSLLVMTMGVTRVTSSTVGWWLMSLVRWVMSLTIMLRARSWPHHVKFNAFSPSSETLRSQGPLYHSAAAT